VAGEGCGGKGVCCRLYIPGNLLRNSSRHSLQAKVAQLLARPCNHAVAPPGPVTEAAVVGSVDKLSEALIEGGYSTEETGDVSACAHASLRGSEHTDLVLKFRGVRFGGVAQFATTVEILVCV
jgi:hypothetical protein